MTGSFNHLVYHIVFSTKHREPRLGPEMQALLYEYMGGIVRNDEGAVYEIGGMPDHVHLLIRYHQKRALSALMRELKSSSSRWIHESFPLSGGLQWQDGYGAFSVSRSLEETVAEYIRNQAEYHRAKTFKEEFLELLEEHGVELDERYVWD